MSDYVLLFRGGNPPASEEEGKKIFAAWTAWFERLGSSVKDPGNPFSTSAKTIAPDGSVTDGSTDTVGGYSIVSADSIDAALALAKDCPALDSGSTVTIHEVDPIM
jgi:hypothetical protein